ncbi:MAG: NAD(P)/FAD-dependent oxidoreductase [Myxococcota bacterium]|nr:NAD(P)/FAD-dependent oxidoreductase [Myxococcota bacterium]
MNGGAVRRAWTRLELVATAYRSMINEAAPAAVAIIGAGFGGLAMGIRLKQAGIHDFVILEKEKRVGGTWRDNHYPGAACDVESHLYSFSFEPWPAWTREYAPQQEILAYLEACAAKHDLLPHIRFGHRVKSASFDERSGVWELCAEDVRTGESRTTRARALVSAPGGLSRPAYPDIPGLASFQGKTMHSARWDDDYRLEGKRVAVIGTGASAVQIVPSIAPRVERLHVFQRTPPWVVPKGDRPIAPRTRWLFRRVPLLQSLVRASIYSRNELLGMGFVADSRLMWLPHRVALLHLRRSVPDPVLRARLTPDYVIGCKRILPTDDYYPALQRPNVELVTDPIREITPRGVVTQEGTGSAHERPVDALVLATGFQAAEGKPIPLRGRDGRELGAVWRGGGAEAYLGTTVAGFPNAFFIVGPNTGLGHTSMVIMIESQVSYILACLRYMSRHGVKLVDVRPDVQARYNGRLQARLAKAVWSTGRCKSWYTTRKGKNTTLYPGFTFEFRFLTRRFDPGDYHLVEWREETSRTQRGRRSRRDRAMSG